MKDILLNVLTVLYGAGGIVTFLGFLPTIKDLYVGKPSANTWTYMTWTVTTLLASLYGLFILRNFTFNIVINLQLAACIAVLVLSIRLQLQKPPVRQ